MSHPLFNNKGRARQWHFVIPLTPLNSSTKKNLSTLPLNAAYCAYVTSKDRTGNKFIEGYIKLISRHRVSQLVFLLGNGFFRTCGTQADVKKILIELKANPAFHELGKYENSSGSRSDLAAFKQAVEAGVTNEQLKVLFPSVCTRYRGYVNNYLIKAGRMELELELESDTVDLHRTYTSHQESKDLRAVQKQIPSLNN